MPRASTTSWCASKAATRCSSGGRTKRSGALRAAGIGFEVVPGVTAALAASAELGISLTRRGLARSVAFLTPRVGAGEKPNDWARTAASADTAVIYMGAGEAQMIASALAAEGVPGTTPVVVVENASLAGSRRFSLLLRDLPRVADSACAALR